MLYQVRLAVESSAIGITLVAPTLGRLKYSVAELLKPADNAVHLLASIRQAWQIGRHVSVQSDEFKQQVNVRLGGLETGTGRYYLIGSVSRPNETCTLAFSTSLSGAVLGGRGTGSDGKALNSVSVYGVSMAYLRSEPTQDERAAQLRRNVAAFCRIAKITSFNDATISTLAKWAFWI